MDAKVVRRQKLKWRIRKKISGTAECPRLSVFRSNKEIYAQLIDDVNGVTIAASNSRGKDVESKGNKVEISKMIGMSIASKAKAKGIVKCVFDRGGYLYHGRVKAIADGVATKGF